MKYISVMLLLFLSTAFFAQTDLENLVSEGIELHEAGKYEAAVSKYKKALKIDKNSELVIYEIGYSYFAMGKHKKSIKYLDKLIEKDGKYLREAYMIKGSCLDLLGKPDEAIELYASAVNQFEEDYLLLYNFALAQYNNGDLGNAEGNLIKGISLNPSHSSSHYLLGVIKLDQGRKIEAFLAMQFFLLIENSSGRSPAGVEILKKIMNDGVEKKDDSNIEITLNSIGEDDDFSSANLMLSLFMASSISAENKGKSEEQGFYENTGAILELLSESTEGKQGLWWDLYVDYFSQLVAAGHVEAYCYYITQSKGPEVLVWMEMNSEKMTAFYTWLQG